MNGKTKGLARIYRMSIIAIMVVAGIVGAYFLYPLLYPRPKMPLIVSTTTSLYETGFLDLLEQKFEQANPNYDVSFISQGTGKAIETAKLGQADLLLVHDPVQELKFLQDGYGVNRKVIAYNFFIIVGPSDDPAGIKGLEPLEALRKIAEAGDAGNALWVSRGDNSGTHAKEKGLWTAAGFKNLSQIITKPWYIEAGTGMTATLALANEKNAYTLSDKASYLINLAKGNIQLAKLVEGGEDLINVYSVIPCNPQKLTNVKFDAAMAFVRYLVSEGQELFKNFGVQDFGEAIFKPWVPVLESGTPADIKQLVEQYAYFEGSECPPQFRYNAGDLYE